MSAERVPHIVCGDCGESYRLSTNMLTGRLIHLVPKVKRAKGSCTHPIESASTYGADGALVSCEVTR